MSNKNAFAKFFDKITSFASLLLSTIGYVPQHATKIRTIAILSSIAFIVFLTKYYPDNFKIAVIYFVISLAFYIGFITLVLRKKGYRLWLIKKYGAEKGFLIYEAILGFIFFNCGSALGYVAVSTSGVLFNYINKELLTVIAIILFVIGVTVKLWAAKVVSIDIYYWKDMFLGKKICKFVVSGPYKYLSNPMYGAGQLQIYGTALFYGSIPGLIAAVLYQSSVFSFHFAVEKPFIDRIYLKKHKKKNSKK